jgi:hypothetical protein
VIKVFAAHPKFATDRDLAHAVGLPADAFQLICWLHFMSRIAVVAPVRIVGRGYWQLFCVRPLRNSARSMRQHECDKKQSQKNVETRAAIQTWTRRDALGPKIRPERFSPIRPIRRALSICDLI